MKILLIGDIMLDKNIYTTSNRSCPENKNLPVCNVKKEEYLLGGCANVAVNLSNLNHKIYLLSYVGEDQNKKIIFNLLDKHNISKDYIITISNRPTITKNRVFLNNKLVCRFDEENNSDIGFHHFEETVKKCFENIELDMIVISDYSKGIINKSGLSEYVINEANKRKLPIIIDPKPKNINFYKNSTIIKANFDEISDIYYKLKKIKITIDDLDIASKVICKMYNISYLVTSLSSEGIFLYNNINSSNFIFNDKYIKQDQVIDVTGAGDIVLSLLSHYYEDVNKGCYIANKIAQESVLHCGVKYINLDSLEQEQDI